MKPPLYSFAVTFIVLLVLCLVLGGCVTTTTRAPDGTVTTVRRQDPKVVRAIAGAVSRAAAEAAIRAIQEQEAKQP